MIFKKIVKTNIGLAFFHFNTIQESKKKNIATQQKKSAITLALKNNRHIHSTTKKIRLTLGYKKILPVLEKYSPSHPA